MNKPSLSLVQQAHVALREIIDEGDTVIDATVGNGHDTLFLAQCVGENGKVYGFDIQQTALDETCRRLDEAGLSQQVSLYHAGHEAMRIALPESLVGRVKAVMFNLGYLPGGDKQRTTTLNTSLAALEQSQQLLMPGGVISVLAYTGHPGGREEAEAVKAWAATLAADYFEVNVLVPPAGNRSAPEWILINRR